MKATITELIPSSSRKSFYGKARVADADDGRRYLISYDTVVASVDRDGSDPRRHSDYRSNTTSAHVKSFLAQFCRQKTDFWGMPVTDRGALEVSL